MPIMSWTDAYSVGVAEIDKQHKKLIDLINALHDAMSKGQAKAVIGKVLGELISYCASHFARSASSTSTATRIHPTTRINTTR